jgi:hypothetical protein
MQVGDAAHRQTEQVRHLVPTRNLTSVFGSGASCSRLPDGASPTAW